MQSLIFISLPGGTCEMGAGHFQRHKKSLTMDDTIKVTLVKSGIGKNKKIRETLKGLGLTKLHKTVTLNNTPAIRGMINKVAFMVRLDAGS